MPQFGEGLIRPTWQLVSVGVSYITRITRITLWLESTQILILIVFRLHCWEEQYLHAGDEEGVREPCK